MSELVRVCPGCGKVNEAREQSCPDCGNSLWRAPRIDAEAVRGAGEPSSPEVQANRGASEAPGPDALREPAQNLGQPAGDGGSRELPGDAGSACLECAESPSVRFRFEGSGILGRKGDIDVSRLPEAGYISRRHAAISFIDRCWYVKNLSESSVTRLNAGDLPHGATEEIRDGDKLTCGKTTFIFRAGG